MLLVTQPLTTILATAWSRDPAIITGLLYLAVLYGVGTYRLWRRAGIGAGVAPWQVAVMAGALLAVAVALVSPLDALAGVLFSAHMVQHLLLLIVAPPLLVLATPGYVSLWALPLGARRAVTGGRALRGAWQAVSHPLIALGVHVAVVWAWHVPRFYGAALRNDALHAFEHLTFLATAWLFWWALLHRLGRSRLPRGAAVLYLFAASVQGSALGALLTFAPAPLYTDYSGRHLARWSLLEDQQLAGLLMWIPSGALYALVAVVLLGRWLAFTQDPAHGGAARRGLAPPGGRLE